MLALPQTNTVQLGPAICCGSVLCDGRAECCSVLQAACIPPLCVGAWCGRTYGCEHTWISRTLSPCRRKALPRLVTLSVAGMVCGNEPTAGRCVLCHRCPDAFAAVLRSPAPTEMCRSGTGWALMHLWAGKRLSGGAPRADLACISSAERDLAHRDFFLLESCRSHRQHSQHSWALQNCCVSADTSQSLRSVLSGARGIAE